MSHNQTRDRKFQEKMPQYDRYQGISINVHSDQRPYQERPQASNPTESDQEQIRHNLKPFQVDPLGEQASSSKANDEIKIGLDASVQDQQLASPISLLTHEESKSNVEYSSQIDSARVKHTSGTQFEHFSGRYFPLNPLSDPTPTNPSRTSSEVRTPVFQPKPDIPSRGMNVTNESYPQSRFSSSPRIQTQPEIPEPQSRQFGEEGVSVFPSSISFHN